MRLEHEIQAADRAPTSAQVAAAQTAMQPTQTLLDQWQSLKAKDLKALDEKLVKLNLGSLQLNTFVLDHGVQDQIETGDEP